VDPFLKRGPHLSCRGSIYATGPRPPFRDLAK